MLHEKHFYWKIIQNMLEKVVPDPFLENKIERISGSIVLMATWGLWRYIKAADHLLSPHLKVFKKIKGLELVSQPHFPHNFLGKIFVLLYSSNWPNFVIWLRLLWDIGQYVYCNCLQTRSWLEVNHIFLIKPFFLHHQKVATET